MSRPFEFAVESLSSRYGTLLINPTVCSEVYQITDFWDRSAGTPGDREIAPAPPDLLTVASNLVRQRSWGCDWRWRGWHNRRRLCKRPTENIAPLARLRERGRGLGMLPTVEPLTQPGAAVPHLGTGVYFRWITPSVGLLAVA